MGVPTFFYWLVSHYEKDIIKTELRFRPDILYLDFNCAIHPAVKRDHRLTLQQMYTEVCSYLEKIINFVQPVSEVYIAIDGVAPKAKMNQQRLRRYKSVAEAKAVRELKVKHSLPVRDDPIDFNMISPGTDFMERLSEKLRKYIKHAPWLSKGLTVKLDDSSRAGEGEHKIMNDLRQRDGDTKVAIYGLDSDLIFLALTNYHPNSVLVRETTQFQSLKKNSESGGIGSGSEFCFLDIDQLRERVLEVVHPHTDLSLLRKFNFRIYIDEPTYLPFYVKDQQYLVYDYVFICFMLGNDFLPSLPPLVIREGGLDLIIQIYKKTQWKCQTTLIKKVHSSGEFEIDGEFFQTMLEELSCLEDGLLKSTTDNRDRRIKNFYRKLSSLPPYEKELERYNFIEDKQPDHVKQGYGGWRRRYYQLHFNLPFKHPKDFTRKLRRICYNYLQGLKWTFLYYRGFITDWWWSYDYDRAPTTVDLLDFYRDFSGLASIAFPSRPPVNCYVQLLSIMPPQSKHLLPETLQQLMECEQLGYLYPVRVELNCYNRKYLWECHPQLPQLELEKLVDAVDKMRDFMFSREKSRMKQKSLYHIEAT